MLKFIKYLPGSKEKLEQELEFVDEIYICSKKLDFTTNDGRLDFIYLYWNVISKYCKNKQLLLKIEEILSFVYKFSDVNIKFEIPEYCEDYESKVFDAYTSYKNKISDNFFDFDPKTFDICILKMTKSEFIEKVKEFDDNIISFYRNDEEDKKDDIVLEELKNQWAATKMNNNRKFFDEEFNKNFHFLLNENKYHVDISNAFNTLIGAFSYATNSRSFYENEDLFIFDKMEIDNRIDMAKHILFRIKNIIEN